MKTIKGLKIKSRQLINNNWDCVYHIEYNNSISIYNSEFDADIIDTNVTIKEGIYNNEIAEYIKKDSFKYFLSTIKFGFSSDFNKKKKALKKLVNKSQNHIKIINNNKYELNDNLKIISDEKQSDENFRNAYNSIMDDIYKNINYNLF